ncbi:MAG: SHOCT-like domain-containing protein, partial [Anaerolineales bacterium]
GNLALRLDPSPGKSYRFNADGNILCRLPSDASAEIRIIRAAKISVRIPEVETSSPIQAPYNLTLGDGDGEMEFSAGGDVFLISQPSDWALEDFEVDIGEDFESMAETIGEQVSQQVEAHMEMLEQQIEAQMGNLSKVLSTSGLSAEKAERIAQHAKQASERAGIRAQEKMRRAQEKLERKLEAARRRAEMKARAAERAARDRRRRPESYQWSQPPRTKPTTEPVSEEERMMILQMLEQGKISIEEAEQLLTALEGK